MTQHTQKANFHRVRTLASSAALAAVLATGFSTISANAQGTSGSSSGATGAMGSGGVTSPSASSASGAAGSGGAAGAMASKGDSKFMTDLAHGNIAEIEAGKMALEKSQNDTVKKFAQQMVDDHTAALTELQTMAQAKGVKLPEDVGPKHKAMAAALKAASGNAFDKQYMKGAGVADHKQTIALLKNIQTNGKDAELKAMATKKLPTVQGHLKMAQQGLTAVSAVSAKG